MHHRIINANYYEAKVGNARSLLRYASNPELPARLRQEALAAIEGWNYQNPIDTTTGLPRENPATRDSIKTVVKSEIAAVLETAENEVLAQSTRVAQLYGFEVDRGVLVAQLDDESMDSEVRVSALNALIKRKDPALAEMALKYIEHVDTGLRSAALKALLAADVNQGITQAIIAAETAPMVVKQQAIALLGEQSDSESAGFLEARLSAILDGRAAANTMLDVIEASRNRQEASIQELVSKYDQSILTASPMIKYAASLEGGSIERGKDVFMNHGAAQCVRCHIVDDYGAEVGPELTAIGQIRDSAYLLESIVDPGAAVAPGYGTMVLTRNSGETVSGLLMAESVDGVELKMPDGEVETISNSDIASKQPPISGMPPMGLLLSPGEVRDLVAYLGSLKGEGKKKSETEHE